MSHAEGASWLQTHRIYCICQRERLALYNIFETAALLAVEGTGIIHFSQQEDGYEPAVCASYSSAERAVS